nr:MAG TPA: hypothetical protein [Caudoviricetes sp.]
MGIKMTTPLSALQSTISDAIDDQRTAMIERLRLVGEKAVNVARGYTGKQYTDRSKNLRSSTGFIIVVDGMIYGVGGFVPCGKGTGGDGVEGCESGKSYAEELAAKFPQGIALIVVAGMEYAAFVQNKGYNVLIEAEDFAINEVAKLLKTIQQEW